MVVDLVKDVHNPGADEDGRVVKVVHEAVKDQAEFPHLLRTIFLWFLIFLQYVNQNQNKKINIKNSYFCFFNGKSQEKSVKM